MGGRVMVMPPELLLCENEGDTDGDTVGETVGDTVGETVGDALGDTVGETVGETEGDTVGDTLGEAWGAEEGLGDGVGMVVDDDPEAGSDGTDGSDGRDADGRGPDVKVGTPKVGDPRAPPACSPDASRAAWRSGPHSRRATPPKTPRTMAMPAAAMAPGGRRPAKGRGPFAGGILGPPATPLRPPSSALGPKRSSRSLGSSFGSGSRSKTRNPGQAAPIPFSGEG
jgi:hypothetical protein